MNRHISEVFGQRTLRSHPWRLNVVQRLDAGRAPMGLLRLRTLAMCDGRVEGLEEFEHVIEQPEVAPHLRLVKPASSRAQAIVMADAVALITHEWARSAALGDVWRHLGCAPLTPAQVPPGHYPARAKYLTREDFEAQGGEL